MTSTLVDGIHATILPALSDCCTNKDILVGARIFKTVTMAVATQAWLPNSTAWP